MPVAILTIRDESVNNNCKYIVYNGFQCVDTFEISKYNRLVLRVVAQGLAHLVRDQGVGGSNPLCPIDFHSEGNPRFIFWNGDFFISFHAMWYDIYMNNVIESLIDRRSCRKYRSEQIPDDALMEVIEAGLYAPSAMNRQQTMMVVLQNGEDIAELSRMNASVMGSSSDPFYGAPTVIVVLARKACPTAVEDGSLVMGNLLNAAHAQGLGSCWIHRAHEEFESKEGKALLKKWGIEGEWRGIGHCIIGYAVEEAPKKARNEGRVKIVR